MKRNITPAQFLSDVLRGDAVVIPCGQGEQDFDAVRDW